MRTTFLSIALLLVFTGTGSEALGADADFEGDWRLVLERHNRQPRTSVGKLRLWKREQQWFGTLQFDVILFAHPHALSEIQIKGRKISFVQSHREWRLAFEGRLKKGKLEGTCVWKMLGTYPFTATRPEPLRRFEDGLDFKAPFPKAEPQQVGTGGKALDGLIEAAQGAGTDALLVMKKGKLLCERHFKGQDEAIHLMSVTKFVTAMGIALLLEEGKIESLDAPLSTWFSEWGAGDKAKVTLRHVLAHTSGIAHGKTAKALNQAQDKVAYVRALDLAQAPGTKFSYNNEAAALLTGVIRAAAGTPTDRYLDAKLFKPLGITKYVWDKDGAGNALTYAQLRMRARDVAKIGLLLLAEGKWKGRQVFPKGAIEMLSMPGSDLNERCGLLWWLVREDGKTTGVYHTGYLGQWLVVLFDSEIVGVRLRRYDGSEDASRELGKFMKHLRDL